MSNYVCSMRRSFVSAVLLMVTGAGRLQAEEAVDIQQLKLEVEDVQHRLQHLDDHAHQELPLQASVDFLMSAGGSSAGHHDLELLQGGGHDPKERGFNLQQVEVALAGGGPSRVQGQLQVVLTDDDIELEEAYLHSAALPHDWSMQGGYYLTDFGLVNPSHPHVWSWIDQPVIASRLLGPDGLRGVGVALGKELQAPWLSTWILGIQQADNDSMTSFLGEGHDHGEDEHSGEEHEAEAGASTLAGWPRSEREIEGWDDYLYSLRWEHRLAATEEYPVCLGFSALYGPNATGEDAHTFLYGADLIVTRRPEQGPATVVWQTEFMRREFAAASTRLLTEGREDALAAEDLADWGLYSQLIWTLGAKWETGIRLDYARGNGEGVLERDHDALRSDRLRVSPLLAYRPWKDTRLRLQYNFDRADFLEDDQAHTIWLGLEMLFATGSAHHH